MTENISNAPGWPRITPRWTSSAKSGVGTSLTGASRVWFTISHGILDEIYGTPFIRGVQLKNASYEAFFS